VIGNVLSMRIIRQDLLIDGDFEGRMFGSGVSFLLVDTDVVGFGPRLHQHPYTETFIIRSGRARFTVGDEELDGEAGQIIVVPALTPHKFANLGPDRFQSTNIHASDTYITEWLE
jgi:mannose-6-phosphate isomerase-like protein (cupin superfamily)